MKIDLKDASLIRLLEFFNRNAAIIIIITIKVTTTLLLVFVDAFKDLRKIGWHFYR